MMRNCLVLLFFSLISFNALSAPKAFTVKEDLQASWKIFKDGKYQLYTAQEKVNTIYFSIDAEKFSGDFLRIGSVNDFVMFVNGKLAAISGKDFSIDSLSNKFGSTALLIAIHQKNISREYVRTTIETPIALSGISLMPESKPSSFFRDFVVIASIILLIMLVVVMRLNPKLASDYFSVSRIFSMREGDDSQIYMRITSSTNILFYVFCSLILAFYLMIVFHFISPGYSVSTYVKTQSFLPTFFQWLLMSLLILVAFFVKIILVYVTSVLFGSRDIAGIHFFNWVRLLLIIFGNLSIVLFFYFILHGQNSTFHNVLLKLIAWCLAGWTIIIFLKLRGRSGYSMFHLFSYICATEIIPLLIIITVLYN
jgi:hypothetical protein